MDRYGGGCTCGAVRFALVGDPLWISVCHCGTCRKRTGSDYGISVVVDESQVASYSGETRTYTRTGDSGNAVHYEFCPNCGSTLRWQITLAPGRQAFAAGVFDNLDWMDIDGEMYTGEAAPWGPFGCANARPGAPDDDWRAQNIACAKQRASK